MKVFEEIERKFLLKRKPKFNRYRDYFLITQWYYKDGHRYRSQFSLKTGKAVYYKTKKTSVSFGTNQEVETILTEKEFNDLYVKLKLEKYPSIKKHRTVIKYKSHFLEIDDYIDLKLVVLEIELDSIKQKITLPKYIQKELLMEVTGIKEFSNRKLAEKTKI